MFSPPIAMKSQERRFVIIVSLLAVTLASLPYLIGLAVTPPSHVFLGTHTVNSGDTYSYLAWVEQGREGHLFFKSLYAAEPQPRSFFHPLFLAMGWVAALSDLPNIVVYHAFRVVIGFGFLLTLYLFIARVFVETRLRRLAFLLAIVASGFGWALSNPLIGIDFWMTEAFTFLNLYESPLNLASLTLLLLAFITFGGWERMTRKNETVFAVAVGLLVLIHPYDALTLGLALGLFLIGPILARQQDAWRTAKRRLGLFVFASVPGVVLHGLALATNPALRSWVSATNNPSPPLSLFISGLGLTAVFAAIGLIPFLRGVHNPTRWLLIAWLAAMIVLLNPIFDVQRKFALGLTLPLAMIAAQGLSFLYARWQRRGESVFGRRIVVAVLGLSLLSPLQLMLIDIRGFIQSDWYVARERPSIEAMEWIRKNSSPDSVVLSSFSFGNALPGVSGRVAYIGHLDQTPDLQTKVVQSDRFFRGLMTPGEASTFLTTAPIRLIVYGPDERRAGYADPAGSYPFLTLRFVDGDAKVYEFTGG